MHIHDEVLAAARRISAERRPARFTPDDIVNALPHLNPRTVRTHVVSRCCVNAPKNHPHKWPYFRRVGRGQYEIAAPYRRSGGQADRVREAQPRYGPPPALERRRLLHGAVSRSGSWYAAECMELAVVTQGRTLDETVANLREAIALHLEGEDRSALGLSDALALQITYEDTLDRAAAT